MDLNLRRLRAFVVVAEELHFTRAAAKLFVAQQALSKQIADLESELETQLFDRTSRKVELTAAGEAFLAMSRDVLARFDRGVEETRRVGHDGLSTLRLGFIVGAALELTTPILSEFTDRHPDIRVELHEFGLSDPTAGLGTGITDVAFIRLPCMTDGLQVTRLFDEPCVVGVSIRHHLNGRKRARVVDLATEAIAIGRTGDQVWRDFWSLANPPGGHVGELIETDSQSEEMEVVAAGMACTITPAAAIRYSPHPGIRFLPIEDYEASSVAVARCASTTNPLVAQFERVAEEVRNRETEVIASIEKPFGE